MSDHHQHHFSQPASSLVFSLLDPHLSEQEMLADCDTANSLGLVGVCVNPCYVRTAVINLKGSETDVGTVIGYPEGAQTTHIKMAEAKRAMTEGARFMEMMVNMGFLRNPSLAAFQDDINSVCGLARMNGVTLHVILDIDYLDKEQIKQVIQVIEDLCVDGITVRSRYTKNTQTLTEFTRIPGLLDQDTGLKALGDFNTREAVILLKEAGYEFIYTPFAAELVGDMIKQDQS